MAQRISRAKQSIRSAGLRFDLPPGPRASRPARRRPARALPHLQRGLHDELGPGPASDRPHHRGHPSGAAAPRAPARRGRGGRPARPDAADRRAPGGPDRRRRFDRATRRTAPRSLGHRADRGRGGPRHPHPRHGADRPVPAAGGDRRGPRRGAERRRDGLAADPRPLRRCSRPSPPARSSRSTEPWRSPWCTGREPASALLGTLDDDARMAQTHRLDAVRGHLLELAGDPTGARAAYERAARMTASIPEQRYLALRAARLR